MDKIEYRPLGEHTKSNGYPEDVAEGLTEIVMIGLGFLFVDVVFIVGAIIYCLVQ